MILTLDYIRQYGFDGLCVVNMSGGKDSITMFHTLLDRCYPVDLVLFADTGVERYETYFAISKVEKLCNTAGIRFVRVKAKESFFEIAQRKGVPNKVYRWCNTDLKVKPMQDFLRSNYPGIPILNYVGVCSDEAHRIQRSYNKKSDSYFCYPLVDLDVSERFCAWFVVDQGYYSDDFVSKFRHSNCWLCPFMWDDELQYLSDDMIRTMTLINDFTPYKYRYSITNFLENFKKGIDK